MEEGCLPPSPPPDALCSSDTCLGDTGSRQWAQGHQARGGGKGAVLVPFLTLFQFLSRLFPAQTVCLFVCLHQLFKGPMGAPIYMPWQIFGYYFSVEPGIIADLLHVLGPTQPYPGTGEFMDRKFGKLPIFSPFYKR